METGSHVIFYEIDEGVVLVGRVLHKSMEVKRRILDVSQDGRLCGFELAHLKINWKIDKLLTVSLGPAFQGI